MKIDFSQELTNIEGEPLVENDKPVLLACGAELPARV